MKNQRNEARSPTVISSGNALNFDFDQAHFEEELRWNQINERGAPKIASYGLRFSRVRLHFSRADLSPQNERLVAVYDWILFSLQMYLTISSSLSSETVSMPLNNEISVINLKNSEKGIKRKKIISGALNMS